MMSLITIFDMKCQYAWGHYCQAETQAQAQIQGRAEEKKLSRTKGKDDIRFGTYYQYNFQ